MAKFDNFFGHGNIVHKDLARSVIHDGRKAYFSTALNNLNTLAVIKMDSNRNFGCIEFGGIFDQIKYRPSTGVFHSFFRDLHYHRRFHFIGRVNNGPCGLKVCSIESSNGIAALLGIFQNFFYGSYHNISMRDIADKQACSGSLIIFINLFVNSHVCRQAKMLFADWN